MHPNNTPSTTRSTSGQTQAPSSTTSNSISIQSTESGAGVIQTYFSSHSHGVLLATAIVKICHNGLTYLCRALIDSGSEGTFISEKLFNNLNIPFKRTYAKISDLNNTLSASVQKECMVTLKSNHDETFEIVTSALVVPHLSGNLPSTTVDINMFTNMPDIPLADPRFFENSKIDLLIGGDVLPFIMLTGVKRNICETLIAHIITLL